MNATSFLRSPAVALPLVRSYSEDFLGFMQKKLHDYCDLVNNLEPEDEITTQIHANRESIVDVTKRILDVLAEYKAGRSFIASVRFQGLMKIIKHSINHMLVNKAMGASLGSLYRLREARTGVIGMTKGELFHIPFQFRHLVGTQRYSIPGLPCLYLGGTLFVCWEELNRPAFHNIFMSRFELDDEHTFKILDFTYTPMLFAEWINMDNPYVHKETRDVQAKERLGHFSILWPLIAACSVRTLHHDAKFKFEYVVPQMLLEWVVAAHDIDGLAYFSVRIPYQSFSYPQGLSNFVFPCKHLTTSGYDEKLQKHFKLTEPVSWPTLSAIDIRTPGTQESHAMRMVFEPFPGKRVPYRGTDFANMEGRMRNLDATPM